MKVNVRIVSLNSHIRRWRYEARLCVRTGRLLGVRAGCRRWSNFAQAKAHYEGGGKYERAFDDSRKWMLSRIQDNLMRSSDYWAGLNRYAEREEALCLLDRLKRRTYRAQERIRKKLRRGR